jgi:hypothetical protein
MDFYEVLDQVRDLLRSRGRVTYRALRLQFKLDDESLEPLKEALLYSQPQVVDDEGENKSVPFFLYHHPSCVPVSFGLQHEMSGKGTSDAWREGHPGFTTCRGTEGLLQQG